MSDLLLHQSVEGIVTLVLRDREGMVQLVEPRLETIVRACARDYRETYERYDSDRSAYSDNYHTYLYIVGLVWFQSITTITILSMRSSIRLRNLGLNTSISLSVPCVLLAERGGMYSAIASHDNSWFLITVL